MKVVVRLTEEEKSLVPDFEQRLATAQRHTDKLVKDKRERFRVVLHEGGHIVQYRQQFGWDVESRGPHLRFENGKLVFSLGSVLPQPTNNYDPLHWQHAMVSVGGFWAVDYFTGVPDDECAVQNDLRGLRAMLGEDADMNQAVGFAEVMLESQLNELNFISELEQACRDYEIAVYGTHEATIWGWREYRPELPGTRHKVIVPYSGNWGMLVEHNGNLKLVVEGKVFRHQDDLRGGSLEVKLTESQREGTSRLVQRWNESVSCETIAR